MQVKWLDEALQDLLNLRKYIARDNPLVASDIAKRIRQATDMLSSQPGMGRPGRVNSTRELVIPDTPYIAPYRVKNDRIEILRVLHGSMQWPEDFRVKTRATPDKFCANLLDIGGSNNSY